jgi:hypothetical protein
VFQLLCFSTKPAILVVKLKKVNIQMELGEISGIKINRISEQLGT